MDSACSLSYHTEIPGHPIEPPLVAVQSLVADAVLDIRYAAADNFMRQAVYPFAAAFLREPTAARLARAAAALRAQGFRLVIYDAYRPLSVQQKMWAINPDPRFVAKPSRASMHNRGAAVDVSLADLAGKALAMPCPFDEFSDRARHSYNGGDRVALDRRETLRAAMEGAGFTALEAEWWHYGDEAGRGWDALDADFSALGQ
jgi:zinc D-Ala-D-Ala dipeptidase